MAGIINKIHSLLLVVLISGITSCVPDKCGEVLCLNEGVCVDGNCACPSGFEGNNCQIPWYEKFAGNWQAEDSYIRDTADVRLNYDVKITGTADSFRIYGLYDSLDGIICKRESYTTFVMRAGQVLRVDSSIIVRNGEGELKNGVVTGVYSLKHGDTTYSMKFRWVR